MRTKALAGDRIGWNGSRAPAKSGEHVQAPGFGRLTQIVAELPSNLPPGQ